MIHTLLNICNEIKAINSFETKNVNSISEIKFYVKGFSIFAINIRSIECNLDEILLSTINDKFDIIVLSETWLTNNYNISLLGYKHYHCLGTLNKSDGISIFVKDCFYVSSLNYNVIDFCNSLDIIILFNNINYRVTGIYRSPSYNVDLFLDSLDNFLTINNKNKFHYICGDININILSDNSNAKNYLNIMSKHVFFSSINGITRSQNDSNSNIDHIFSKNLDINLISSYIIRISITDHYGTSILTDVDSLINNKKSEYVSFNQTTIKKINYNKLNSILNNEDWNKHFFGLSINDALTRFNEKICTAINSCTNEVKIKNCRKFIKLKKRITRGILVSINKKEKMYKQKRKRPFDLNVVTKFSKYKNLLQIVIKNARILHYQNEILQANSNTKSTWRIINEIIYNKNKPKIPIASLYNNDNKLVKDKFEICNILNDYFTNVGENISKNIKKKNYHKLDWKYLNNNCHVDESLFLNPISTNEIENYLNLLKDECSYYEYGMTNYFLKRSSKQIS